MRIAHLILTHALPEQLERFIDRLQHNDADIYIHLDGKSDINYFQFLWGKSQVYFIRNRIIVHWGTYSLVQATLNSFEEMLAVQEDYDFLTLLSAQDYPIKSVNYIHKFLDSIKVKAFMHCLSIETEWQEGQIRLRKWDFGTFGFRGKYCLQAI